MKDALHSFLYKKNRQQQIKGFYYTAKHRSFSEAARIMSLTQSTVTLQIQSLERDLGLQLLKRNSKPLSLTEDGEEFYKMACPLIQEFESVVELFLKSKKQKEQKKIDIAVHHVAISYLMPSVIADFKKLHPEAKITIRNLPPADAVKRLKEGEIDAIFYPNISNQPEFQQIEIISYNPILIMNNRHPLAKKEITKLKDLQNFDLIRIDRNLISLPLFEEALKTYNIKGSLEFEDGNWEMLKSFVKKNNFAAVISEVCLDKNDNDLTIKNLSKFFPVMTYSLAIKNTQIQRQIAQDFIKSIKNTLSH